MRSNSSIHQKPSVFWKTTPSSKADIPPTLMPLPSQKQHKNMKVSSDHHASDAICGNEKDVSLMQRVAEKDEKAFEELITRHQGAIIGTVSKMLGNSSDSEDIAQQVFIRLWKSAPRYKPSAKFTTYLYTITRNLVFNESRRRSRKKEHSIQEREDDLHLQVEDPHNAPPDGEILHAELQHAVDKAIASLPEKQRMAVILRRYEDLPYDEIANVLNLSISAVKSQLFRARGTLRKLLKNYLEN